MPKAAEIMRPANPIKDIKPHEQPTSNQVPAMFPLY